MSKLSYLGNSDINAIEALYAEYRKNPEALDLSWRRFFEGFEFAQKSINGSGIQSETIDKEFKVINLIDTYRKRGHLFTLTNPVRTRRKYFPTLDIENFGLSESDMETEFYAGKDIGLGKTSLKNIVDYLDKTYCQSIGAEYMFIRDAEKLSWLKLNIEMNMNSRSFSDMEKKEIYIYLRNAVGFEKFIHRKFVGQKRFSLEGAETLVPALNSLIEKGSELGVEELTIGMAHRGRLNVLANVLQKTHDKIFKEFEADAYEEGISLGDVKYHLGYGNTVKTKEGKPVILNLAPNPSHLEAVSPIIQGIARARINSVYNGDVNKLVPVLIHGDAAIASQGVVYEVIQMSELPGYLSGGTIHLVINNQIGFTTNYLDARSSTYCTDIAKVTKSPVFHVNGDDVEALVHTMSLAIQYRQTFHSDVFIDILCYRKFGHNEGDEPRFTQPLLYKAIEKHPDPRVIYGNKLVKEGVLSEDELDESDKVYTEFLEQKLEKAREIKKVSIPQFLKDEWKGFSYSKASDFDKVYPTGVKKKDLKKLAAQIFSLPDNKKFFKKITRLMEERRELVDANKADWAIAELMAYASLLGEGHPVRVSGQDSIRGTFSHRHAGLVIEDTDQLYIPLKNLSPEQPPFDIYNSPLSEYGVMGFEYGYALAASNSLVIWEAQFGDFVNVAQVIIDQYISSGEEKWGLMNGLVLLLPHGFEGQGPEHSSARIERFLNLSANQNMQVVNPTTPANFFHLLRQHMKRNFRIPLVVFTPKSLLRHPACISSLNDFEKGQYQSVIDDDNVDLDEVRRIVLCSGKIYYDLLEMKQKFDARDLALIRIEQLSPFPVSLVDKIIKRYPNNLLTLWVQEEPVNMGAWYHIQNYMSKHQIIPVARQASGSPAVGLFKIHEAQQNELMEKVFRRCDCERKLKYCGLQCVVGSSRKEVLKQHYYFDI
jgi:2-oxoglutarate dehydrogenase E1 component